MGTYSIKDLEKLSGIKAHTIRIWEKRYNLLSPDRTNTNIRSYDDEALKRLLSTATLVDNGVRISKVANLESKDLAKQVENLHQQGAVKSVFIEQMIVSMVDMDEQRFEKLMSDAILRHGFETSILEVIYPFLSRIGVMWQTGNINPAQEHFISNLIRQKLIVAIDGQMMNQRPDAKTFILFLPEGELHEIGLLFYSYLIRKSGHKLVYLGQTLPYSDLKAVGEIHTPDYFLMAVSPALAARKVNKLFQRMSDDFPGVEILAAFMAGAEKKFSLPQNVCPIRVDDEFRDLLK